RRFPATKVCPAPGENVIGRWPGTQSWRAGIGPRRKVTGMRQLVRYHSLIDNNARWDGFSFREGDIIVSTPPKCGTTWTQMICAMLIFQTPDLPLPLDLISPWL